MILTENIINKEIRKLNFKQALTFAYILCYREFSNYEAFCEFENFGKPELLYESIVAIRKHILCAENQNKISELSERLFTEDELAPDTEEFPGNLAASLAIDTVSSIYECLKFVETKTPEHIENIAYNTKESLAGYFVVSNKIDQNMPRNEYFDLVYNSKILQTEMQSQYQLIEAILNTNKIDNQLLIKLKLDKSSLGENALKNMIIDDYEKRT